MPVEIIEHCGSIELTIETPNEEWTIERSISTDFKVRVVGKRYQTERHFDSEKDFSLWLLESLTIPGPALTSKQGGEAIPYAGTILPCIWVDQDNAGEMFTFRLLSRILSKLKRKRSFGLCWVSDLGDCMRPARNTNRPRKNCGSLRSLLVHVEWRLSDIGRSWDSS